MENTTQSNWMRQVLGLLLIILLALLIILLFTSNKMLIKGTPQDMQVTAQGTVTAVPDLATITLGVSSQAMDAVEVKNVNNQQMNQVIAFIKQQNVEAKDISTSGFYIAPKYNYVDGKNQPAGYQASQTVTVKVYHIDESQAQLEKILDGVVNHGANEIQGVRFSFLDTDKFKAAAQKLAIVNAKEKAHMLTKAAGLRLGKVTNVIEASSELNAPMAPVAFAALGKSTAPNVEPGTQDIVANITLVFKVY